MPLLLVIYVEHYFYRLDSLKIVSQNGLQCSGALKDMLGLLMFSLGCPSIATTWTKM